jgi:hypothetical protein
MKIFRINIKINWWRNNFLKYKPKNNLKLKRRIKEFRDKNSLSKMTKIKKHWYSKKQSEWKIENNVRKWNKLV